MDFLIKLRDLLHDVCLNKKKEVHLNLLVGELILYANLSMEFKSSNFIKEADEKSSTLGTKRDNKS